MTIIRIEWEGKKWDLEVDESFGIPITFNVKELRELDLNRGSSTKSITISGTSENNKILKALFNINNDLSFDVKKKVSAELISDSVTILRGFIQILSVNYIDRGNLQYEAIVYDELIDFFLNMGEKTLTGNENPDDDLDFSRFNHVLDTINLEKSWNEDIINTQSLPYIWTIFDTPRNDWHYIDDYTPSFFVKAIFDAIFEKWKVKYNSDFLNSDYLKRCIIPYNGGIEYDFDDDNKMVVGLTACGALGSKSFIGKQRTTVGADEVFYSVEGIGTTSMRNLRDAQFADGLSLTLVGDIQNGVTIGQNGTHRINLPYNIKVDGPTSDWLGSEFSCPDTRQPLVKRIELPFVISKTTGKMNVNCVIKMDIDFKKSASNVLMYAKIPIGVNNTNNSLIFQDNPDMVIRFHLVKNFTPDLTYVNANMTEGSVAFTDVRIPYPNLLTGLTFSQTNNLSINFFDIDVDFQDYFTVVAECLTSCSYYDVPGSNTGTGFRGGGRRYGSNISGTGEIADNPVGAIASPEVRIVFSDPGEMTVTYLKRNIGENNLINLNNHLPKNWKQKDFIKSIINTFNLYICPSVDEERTLLIEPRDLFYRKGKVIDLRNRQDDIKDRIFVIEKPSIFKTLTEYMAKELILEFSEDSNSSPDNIGTLYNFLYEEVWKIRYGRSRTRFDNENINEVRVIRNDFSPTPIINSSGDLKYITSAIDSRNPRTKPKILFYNKIDFPILLGYGLVYGNPTQFLNPGFYMTGTHWDNPLDPSQELNYSISRSYFYAPEKEFTENNLFNNFWFNTIRDIDNAKVIEIEMYISKPEAAKLQLNTKFFLEINDYSGYFIISKIIEWNATTGRAKLELISWDENNPVEGGAFDLELQSPRRTPLLERVGDRDDIAMVNNVDNGAGNEIEGEYNVVSGIGNKVSGFNNDVNGFNNIVEGDRNSINGDNNEVSGDNITVRGSDITATIDGTQYFQNYQIDSNGNISNGMKWICDTSLDLDVSISFSVFGNWNIDIDWGDGTRTIDSGDGSVSPVIFGKTYGSGGIFEIEINGDIIGFSSGNISNNNVIRVERLGQIGNLNRINSFSSFNELREVVAKDGEVLLNQTSLGSMFEESKNVRFIDLRTWRTDNVTDMTNMFVGFENISSDPVTLLGIGTINLENVEFFNNFLTDTIIRDEDYEELWVNLGNITNKKSSVQFDANNGLVNGSPGWLAREDYINNFGWGVTDLGDI